MIRKKIDFLIEKFLEKLNKEKLKKIKKIIFSGKNLKMENRLKEIGIFKRKCTFIKNFELKNIKRMLQQRKKIIMLNKYY